MHMTAFIRSLCLSALLAAGATWAQQQPVDNPDNPHSTKTKEKQTSDVPSSTTNPQVNQAEQGSPRSPQNKDVAAGQTTAMTDKDQMSGMDHRSEEHTSELQSPYDLVCRLLLEKKKIQHKNVKDREDDL